jgi:hypothetical protein
MVSKATIEPVNGAQAVVLANGNDRVAGALSLISDTCAEPVCSDLARYLSQDTAGATVTGGCGSGVTDHRCPDASHVPVHRDDVLMISIADHTTLSFVRLVPAGHGWGRPANSGAADRPEDRGDAGA